MRIRARPIAAGRASGQALVHNAPFSFVGGADPSSGALLDRHASAPGERLADRIFAFPHGKGSTVGSYVLYGLTRRGVGPAGLVTTRADGIVAVGAVLSGIPMVDRVDVGGFQSGDRVSVDGDRGVVELPDVRGRPVVSAVLRNQGRILIVRRSREVGSFPGRWSAVSGYLEGREEPKDRAVIEIREETGLRAPRLQTAGSAVLARHESTMYVIHPFLFDVQSRRVRLDWENVEHRWIAPNQLGRFDTVPRLKDVVEAVLPNSTSTVPSTSSLRSPRRRGRPPARAMSSGARRARTG